MQTLGHAKLDAALDAVRTALAIGDGSAPGPGVGQAFLPVSGGREAGSPGAVERCLAELEDGLRLVLREHAGMAEELLRTYEQLGIVFEVTRRLPTVHTEHEVVRLFVDSLRATYQDNEIVVARSVSGAITYEPGPSGALEEIGATVRASAESRKVVVVTLPEPKDGVEEIMSAPVTAGEDVFCAIVFAHGAGARRFVASDMSLVEALVVYCGDLVRNYRLAHELQKLSVDMVRALVSAIDQKDEYTSGHSNRVGNYARLLGSEVGLDEAALQMLEWAALLHDVGKIGIRDEVLKKAGKLTAEEFDHIKEHPVRSYEVVRRVPQLRAALDGIRHHHERYDGKGYPDGLRGEDIPLQARIVQVADIFDALTTSRSYRAAFTAEKALGILREESGKVCDPRLVEVFTRLIHREIAAQTLVFERPVASPDPAPCATKEVSS